MFECVGKKIVLKFSSVLSGHNEEIGGGKKLMFVVEFSELALGDVGSNDCLCVYQYGFES